MTARMPSSLIGDIEAWADAHDTTRSEALCKLVEMGLSVYISTQAVNPRARTKAATLAEETIDQHTDQTAPPEEQASRKRKLLKGPKEFRDIRRDHM